LLALPTLLLSLDLSVLYLALPLLSTDLGASATQLKELAQYGAAVVPAVGAVLFAALAILTATTLRRIRPSGADTEDAGAPAAATAP
jgi:MFS family permease